MLYEKKGGYVGSEGAFGTDPLSFQQSEGGAFHARVFSSHWSEREPPPATSTGMLNFRSVSVKAAGPVSSVSS
ncbi:hypothetical protein PGIGA_G00076910 [Pangasianodon gigas]|uniref:Uncharacterized protein n=1 Tax=Pangasianodon gigas TaxID=30993 RepID=A0ACC5X9W9_PANGG|nr:hypothetical protein [Pangasianodon gigas]